MAIALTSFASLAATGAAARAEAPCRWTAPPYARVRDDARVPDFHARAEYAPNAAPLAPPVPAYDWNPVFPIDRGGRIHGRGDGAVSSIVTISGAGCTPVHVAVLVYGDGYVPQRGLALDYGAVDTRDEYSAGKGDFTTVNVHAEAEGPLRLRNVWISADARSVGYRHDDGFVTNVGGDSRTFRPAFDVRDNSLEVRTGYALRRGGPTLELAYLNAATNASRPGVSGLGFAAEIPPSLDETFSAYGAFAYYPNLTGGGIAYRGVRYRFGGVLSLAPTFGHPYYFEFAIVGDRRADASRAPSSVNYGGVMLGIGYRLGGIP